MNWIGANGLVLLIAITMLGCQKPPKENKPKCEICEVIKGMEVTEMFKSCDSLSVVNSRVKCEELAAQQLAFCVCQHQHAESFENSYNGDIFNNLLEIKSHVSTKFDHPQEVLYISESFIDSAGFNMAIVTELILAKGYVPYAFEYDDQFRIYYYKKNDYLLD